MSKSRKTRKQKEHRQAQRDKGLSGVASARKALTESLRSPADMLSAKAVATAAAQAAVLDEGASWQALGRWIGASRLPDAVLVDSLRGATAKLPARRAASACCAAIAGLLEVERHDCALALGEAVVAGGLQHVVRTDEWCAAAAGAMSRLSDSEWVVSLLEACAPRSSSDGREPTPDQVPSTVGEPRRLSYEELFWSRRAGARAGAGFEYQHHVALLWLVRSLDAASGIESVGLERLEDIDITLADDRHNPDLDEFGSRVFIQGKTRDASQGGWTVARLLEEGVIQRFAELHSVADDADFLFVSNRELTTTGCALETCCRKLRAGGNRCIGGAESGSPLGLTAEESKAEDAVRVALGDVAWDDRRLFTFLRHCHFETLPSAEADATLRLARSRRLGSDVAHLAGCLLYVEVTKRSAQRQTITREWAAKLVDEVVETAGAAIGTAGTTELLLRPLRCDERPEADPQYWHGVRAAPRHILANQDVLRPDVLAQVDSCFSESMVCVIRGASGQGKSTCMYRWAVEHRDRFRTWIASELRTQAEVEAVAALVKAEAPSPQKPVLILIDDIFDSRKAEVERLLEMLARMDGLYVLATSREDDWREVRPEGVRVGAVRVSLDAETARRVAEAVDERGGGARMPWQQAFELCQARGERGGLLMEYAHYLLQGTGLEETLREQVSAVDGRHPDLADSIQEVLRHVVVVDAYGCSVSWEGLTALPAGHDTGLRRCVDILKDEHLIVEQENGRLAGLHRLRSETIAAIVSETVPLAVTVRHLVDGLPPDDLIALLRPALADARLDPQPLLERLWQRMAAGHFQAEHLPQVFGAVFEADQRRFAELCRERLATMDVRTSVLSLLPSERMPDGTSTGVFDVAAMPDDARAAVAAMPERKREGTLLFRLLHSANHRVLADILSGAPPGAIAHTIDWVSYGRPEAGHRLLTEIGTQRMLGALTRADLAEFAALMAAARRADAAAADGLLEATGGARGVAHRLLSADHRILSIRQVAGHEWEVSWLQSPDWPESLPRLSLPASGPDGTSWELGQLLLRCIPSAELVRVDALDETQTAYGFRDYREGHKEVRRERAYPPEDVARNAVSCDAFLVPYRTDTASGFSRQLNDIRALSVRGAGMLVGLLASAAPVKPRSATGGGLAITDGLDDAFRELDGRWQRLPLAPRGLFMSADSGHDGSPRERDMPTTYFSRLTHSNKFVVRGFNVPDSHKRLLASVNAGMAVSEQRKMLEELRAGGLLAPEDEALAEEESAVLSTLFGLVRVCDSDAIPNAKRQANALRPLVSALRVVLADAPQGLDGEPGRTRTLLANAAVMAQKLHERLPGGDHVQTLEALTASILDGVVSPQSGLREAFRLCDELLAIEGAGLLVEVVDALEFEKVHRLLHEGLGRGAGGVVAPRHVHLRIDPVPTDSGFRTREVLLGLTCSDFWEFDAGAAEVLAEASQGARGPEPTRLALVICCEGGVAPEDGRTLYIGGGQDACSPEYVLENWHPLEVTTAHASRLGLPLTEKPGLLRCLDDAFGALTWGVSWAAWLSDEMRRPEPELADRVATVGALCRERIDDSQAAIAAAARDARAAGARDDLPWLVEAASQVLAGRAALAQEGRDDGSLCLALAAVRKQQVPATEAAMVTDAEADLIRQFLTLRIDLLTQVYAHP